MKTKRERLLLVISILLLVVLSYSAIYHLDDYKENPFNRVMGFMDPSFAVTDDASNIYIIDQGMMRIVKINNARNLSYVLAGGQESGNGFYMALELAVDSGGNLYVLNNILDTSGQYVEREEIVRYTADGKFKDIVYSVQYTEENRPIRSGNLCGISVRGSSLFCYMKEESAFKLIKTAIDAKKSEVVQNVAFNDARSMIIDFATAYNSDESFVSTKKGEIFHVGKTGVPELYYSGSSQSIERATSLPWEIEVDSRNNLYFTDLLNRSIKSIDTTGNMKNILDQNVLKEKGYENNNAIFYRISALENGSVTTVANGNIVLLNPDGAIGFFGNGTLYPMKNNVLKVLLWVQLLLILVSAAYIVRRLYRIFRGRPPKVLLQSLFIILVIGIATFVASNTIFGSFEKRYDDEVFQRIRQTLYMTSRSIDGDVFKKITKPEHFMNEDYKKVRDEVHAAFNNNADSWSEGFYGALYTIADNKAYVIMYYDDSKCPYYPLYEDGSEQEYMNVFNNGITTTTKDSDAEGMWMYGMTPVRDSTGNIVGVLEIGTDLYGFMEENKKLKSSIILETVTLLIILVFVMVEITIFADVVSKRRSQQKEAKAANPMPTGLDVLMIRPICFMVYTACFLSGSFMPILMKKLYTQPIWNIPDNVVLALPLSAEALFLSLAALIGGYIIDKKGWKPTFLAGLAILLGGQLLSAFAVNPFWLILARAVAGAGMGLTFISMQNFVVLPETEDEKSEGISALNSGGFAGVNVGLIIGGMLAERFGYSNVFFVSAVLVVLCILISIRMVQNAVQKQTEKEEGSSIKDLRDFFLSYKVMAFFILVFLPAVISMMFLDYFFPLFAEGTGMSPAGISRAFLLSGLSIIYLGPVLTKYLSQKIGSYFSMLLAAIFMATALLQFSVFGTMFSALVAILLLGISESFGITARINYFSSTEAATRLGYGKALGYFGLVENLGQVAGPIIYGLALGLGSMEGIGFIGQVFILLVAMFAVTTLRKEFLNRPKGPKGISVSEK